MTSRSLILTTRSSFYIGRNKRIRSCSRDLRPLHRPCVRARLGSDAKEQYSALNHAFASLHNPSALPVQSAEDHRALYEELDPCLQHEFRCVAPLPLIYDMRASSRGLVNKLATNQIPFAVPSYSRTYSGSCFQCPSAASDVLPLPPKHLMTSPTCASPIYR